MNPQPVFRKRLALLPGLLLLLLLAAACGGARQAAPSPALSAAQIARNALSSDERRRFDELFLEAVRYKQKDDRATEHDLLEEALRINPDAPEALYEMALLRLDGGGLSDSLKGRACDSLLERAAKLEPANKFYKSTLANFCIRRGEYSRAVALLEEMQQLDPSSELLSTLVSLYETTNDYDGAIRTLDRLEQLEGKSEAYSLEKFKIYAQMKDDARAYATIEALCAEYPYDLRFRVLLGDLYGQNGHDTMALAVYRDVLAAEPDNSYAQMSLLNYYRSKGLDDLYDAYADSVALNPRTDSEARLQVLKTLALETRTGRQDTLRVLRLFQRCLQAPQEDRSVAELYAYYISYLGLPPDSLEMPMRKILDVEPDYDRARLQLLQLLLNRDDMAGAADLCKGGRLYNPSQLIYYYYEGICRYRLGDDAAARDILRRGADKGDREADEEITSDLYATLGDLLHDAGDSEGAYAAYDTALVYNEENYLCMNNYAYFLSLDGKRLDEAEDLARQAVESDPQSATYLDTYAWVFFVKGQYEQARIYIDQTLRHSGEDSIDANLLEHAGDIYYKCGERSAALDFWRRALKISDDAERRALLRRKIRLRRYVAG